MARRVVEPENATTRAVLHKRSQRLRIGHVGIAKCETVVELMMAVAAKRETVVKATRGLLQSLIKTLPQLNEWALQSLRLSYNSRSIAAPETVVEFMPKAIAKREAVAHFAVWAVAEPETLAALGRRA